VILTIAKYGETDCNTGLVLPVNFSKSNCHDCSILFWWFSRNALILMETSTGGEDFGK